MRTDFCENFKFHPSHKPSRRSLKTYLPSIEKLLKNGQSIYSPIPLTHHQLFFLDYFGLTQVSKLKIRIISFLSLRVKTSILSVRFFMIIARIIYGVTMN